MNLFLFHILAAHSLHPLWQKIHSLDGKMIYYSPYTGRYMNSSYDK